MSIILDALRKAEAGRREPDRVGLIGAPLTRVPLRSRIPLWLPAVAIVLLLSAGVGAYVMHQSKPAQTEVVDRSAPPAATEAKTAPPAAPKSAETDPIPAPATSTAGAEPAPQEDAPMESPDVRPLSLEARAAAPAPPSAAALKPQPGSIEVRDLGGSSEGVTGTPPRIKPGSVEVRDLLVEQGAPPVPPESESPTPQAPAAADQVSGTTAVATARPATNPLPQNAAPPTAPAVPAVPSVDDLVASGQLDPPNLSLDMHAYTDDPGARFVYINMRRYHAGDTTREGAVVEDITPEGVVLRLHGLRFLLQSH